MKPATTGSATGNPRNKVALKPGHSLMDWIRLGNSGADLTSVGGKPQTVDEELLKEHHKESNAWLVIRGKVYNVAQYLDFHPGGGEELMKGAGKDATKLFNEVHPWVNYESILQKCLVGRFVKNKTCLQDDAFKDLFNTLTPPSSSSPPLQMTWTQTSKTASFRFQTASNIPHILIRVRLDNHIRILIRIRSRVTVFSFHPVDHLQWPCKLKCAESGLVDITFRKTVEGLWNTFGQTDEDHGKTCDSAVELENPYQVELVSRTPVTSSSSLFVLKFKDPVIFWVPIGHDIRISEDVDGVQVTRRYTPTISPCSFISETPPSEMNFLIKEYPEGALTPSIFKKKHGDVINISGIAGDFDVSDMHDVSTLYLIAAGTGITPMTRLIAHCLDKCHDLQGIKLLFMDRREEDIMWRKELDALATSQPKFSVMYGLSQPDDAWSGLKGRLCADHLVSFLPPSESEENGYLCVCGPIDFNRHVESLSKDLGWSRSYFFDG